MNNFTKSRQEELHNRFNAKQELEGTDKAGGFISFSDKPHLSEATEVIDEQGNNNTKLGRLTSKESRDLYRGAGIDPSNLTIEEQKNAIGEEIIESPHFFGPNGEYKTENYKNLYIEHEGKNLFLTHVSERWGYLQPKEVIEVFAEYCDENGLKQDRIGIFKNVSEKIRNQGTPQEYVDYKATLSVFATAWLNEDYEVTPGDLVTGNLQMVFPYKNGSSIPLGIISTRKTCTNSQASLVTVAGKKIIHTHLDLKQRIQQGLKASKRLWQEEKKENFILADTYCSQADATIALLAHFGNKLSRAMAKQALIEMEYNANFDKEAFLHKIDLEKESTTVVNVIEMYRTGYYTGSELAGCKETMWGLLNSLTEFLNWQGKSAKNLQTLLETKSSEMNSFKKTILTQSYSQRKEVQTVRVSF